MLAPTKFSYFHFEDRLAYSSLAMVALSAFMGSIALVCLMIAAIYFPLHEQDQESIFIDSLDYVSHKNYVTFKASPKLKSNSPKNNISAVLDTSQESPRVLSEAHPKPSSQIDSHSNENTSNTEASPDQEDNIEQVSSVLPNQFSLAQPSAGHRKPPVYPQRARLQNIEGYVLVAFTIQADGTVADIVIIESEPKNVFEQSVIKAVKNFKYPVTMVDGKAVPVTGIRKRFEFKLDA